MVDETARIELAIMSFIEYSNAMAYFLPRAPGKWNSPGKPFPYDMRLVPTSAGSDRDFSS